MVRRRVQLRSPLSAADRIIRILGWAAPKQHKVEHSGTVGGRSPRDMTEAELEAEFIRLEARALGVSEDEVRTLKGFSPEQLRTMLARSGKKAT